MHGSSRSIGWRNSSFAGDADAGSGSRPSSAQLGRPSSAPILHMDIHRFAPSSLSRAATQQQAPPTPQTQPTRVRAQRPQSAQPKPSKPAQGLQRPGSAASLRPGSAAAARRAPAPLTGSPSAAITSLTPLSDKWLSARAGPVNVKPTGVARPYAATDETGGSKSGFRGRESLLLTSMHAGAARSGDGMFGGSARDRSLPAGTTAEQAARAAKVQRMLSGANMYVSIAHKLKFEVGFNPLVDVEQPDEAGDEEEEEEDGDEEDDDART